MILLKYVKSCIKSSYILLDNCNKGNSMCLHTKNMLPEIIFNRDKGEVIYERIMLVHVLIYCFSESFLKMLYLIRESCQMGAISSNLFHNAMCYKTPENITVNYLMYLKYTELFISIFDPTKMKGKSMRTNTSAGS